MPYVQGNFSNWSSNTNQQQKAFTNAQTAGNCNVVFVMLPTGGHYVTSVTDTAGNNYARLTGAGQIGGASVLDVFVACNIAASLAGANTVKALLSGNASFGDLQIYEYSGADLTNPADLLFSAAATSGTTASATGTPILGGTVIACIVAAAPNTQATLVAGTGYTKRAISDTFGVAIEDSNSPAVAGTPVTASWSISSTAAAWAIAAIILRPPTTIPAYTGNQVMLNGTVQGNLGANNSQLPLVADANALTIAAAPDSGYGYWAGWDAGVATQLVGFRLSAQGGREDLLMGGLIQASNDATWATGVVTLMTITTRPLTGTLVNKYNVPITGNTYRYFRYLAPYNSFFAVADLDFYVQTAAGVVARPITPTVSPPRGDFDQPTRIRISSLTSSASFYYTTDGSTPTISSNPYLPSNPPVLSAGCTLKSIAIDSTYGSSRVQSSLFHIPSAVVSTDKIFDDRGYPLWAIDGTIFLDPVSGWYYWYGTNYDEPGVITSGFIPLSIYKSADLKNWIYVGNIPVTGPPGGGAIGSSSVTGQGRCCVIYNALNNNYVMWSHGGTYAANLGMFVFVSPNPETGWVLHAGPITTFGSYDGNGDCTLFVDPADGITAYFVHASNGNVNMVFDKLSTDYLSASGVQTAYVSSTTFGGTAEAPQVIKVGATYFLLYSGGTEWQPNTNKYAYSTTPVGPWTQGGNPFQTSSNPDSLGLAGTQYGVSQANAYTIAFDSQTAHAILIPGRNAVIYTGDRYDNGLPNGTTSSTTANFQAYRRIRLPMSIIGNAITISWQSSWSIDSTFPTLSGAPAAATGLSGPSSNAIALSWVNNEPNPYSLYLDRATDPGMSLNVVSEVLPIGTTSFTDSVVSPGSTYYYQIRTVNANGSTVSAIYSVTAINPAPPIVTSQNPGATMTARFETVINHLIRRNRNASVVEASTGNLYRLRSILSALTVSPQDKRYNPGLRYAEVTFILQQEPGVIGQIWWCQPGGSKQLLYTVISTQQWEGTFWSPDWVNSLRQ